MCSKVERTVSHPCWFNRMVKVINILVAWWQYLPITLFEWSSSFLFACIWLGVLLSQKVRCKVFGLLPQHNLLLFVSKLSCFICLVNIAIIFCYILMILHLRQSWWATVYRFIFDIFMAIILFVGVSHIRRLMITTNLRQRAICLQLITNALIIFIFPCDLLYVWNFYHVYLLLKRI